MTSPDRTVATVDLDHLCSLARMLGRQAADLVAAGRTAAVVDIDTKSDPTDVVTAMDRACEALLRERLRELRPGDGVHGEEHAESEGRTGVRWIIDPIDGTVNYLYGLENYSISIAVEVDGDLVVGVVTKPATGEQFHAVRGGGAFLDDWPIGCSAPTELSLTLLATGFGYVPSRRAAQGAVVGALLAEVRDIRRMGSAALDLCNVAAGRVDAYYEWGTHIWDWAAGAVICREAGVDVRLPENDEGLVVACAPSVTDALNGAIRSRIKPEWQVPR
ncbi:MAG: inositol monophosphatase family protein [Cumulibacter sp.]